MKTLKKQTAFPTKPIASLLLVSILSACNGSSSDGGVVDDVLSASVVADEEIVVDESLASKGEFLKKILQKKEAHALLHGLEADGGTPFDYKNPVNFPEEFNVFIPSITGVDLNLLSDENPSGPTGRFPMFRGFDPSGNEVDYIITETSSAEVAQIMGIIHSPRIEVEAGSPGTQNVTIENGNMVFEGSVDFSPKRFVTPGNPADPDSPNAITQSEFPPAEVSPGAIGDSLWSSLVVLPSGLTFNAQLVANETGIHDRIPDREQDDQSNPNLDRENRFVVMQLLDGWHAGDRYYFHIVTDTSAAEPAAIELGVFAPLLAELPSAGEFPEGHRLPFAPSANGIEDPNGLGQGLNISAIDQTIDPVNVFPIDPTDNRYSPMWDAHIYMWTADAIANGQRSIVTSIDEIDELREEGLVENFFGNTGPANEFLAGLSPTGAIINCPVILQPNGSVINTTFGTFENQIDDSLLSDRTFSGDIKRT